MCFWSCLSRQLSGFTAIQPPTAIHTNTHSVHIDMALYIWRIPRTAHPTHTLKHTNKCIHAHAMYKNTHSRTLSQQVRLSCTSSCCVIVKSFLFNPYRVRIFAQTLACPAGCIQAAVTLQTFRGLWAKRCTQGLLKGGGDGSNCEEEEVRGVLLNPPF